MQYTQQIRSKARELLTSKQVECIIGYQRASDGINARPAFVYEDDEIDKLIFDQTCTHNLTRYLLDKKGKKVAIVVKPCDAKAINVLILEKQIKRHQVYIIGVVCQGVVQIKWGESSEKLLSKCQLCQEHTPVIYDVLIGELPIQKLTSSEPYNDIAKLESKSPVERASFWAEKFALCIRCYSCREVCPVCYCPECFVEQIDPVWVGIRIAKEENQTYHLGRVFHLAGRCTGCNECERVCPVNIPLSLLNRKVEKEVWELFGFKAGVDAETLPPLATFKKDENLGMSRQ